MYLSTIKVENGSWRESRGDDDGYAEIVGPAAEDAAASGAPVGVGGRYDSTARGLDNGDRGEVALDAAARLKVVPGDYTVLDVTLSLDTNPYATYDVLADMQEVVNAHYISGGCIEIVSLVVLDKDDNGQDMEIVFMNASGSLGSENSAVSISDADADKIVSIVSTNTPIDYINSKISIMNAPSVDGLGVICKLATTSLYVGAVLRSGTPTYSADGITLKIGIRRL